MLTNTLLLYVTQEAWAKARARLIAARHVPGHDEIIVPRWREKTEGRQQSPQRESWYRPPRTRH